MILIRRLVPHTHTIAESKRRLATLDAAAGRLDLLSPAAEDDWLELDGQAQLVPSSPAELLTCKTSAWR